MEAVVRRAFWAFLVLAAAGLAVLARLFQLQVLQHREWAALAQGIQEDRVELPSRRGALLDRHGTPLAYDVPAYSIALDNYHVTKPELLVELLVRELGLPREEARAKVYRPGYFTWLARNVDWDKARRFEALAQAQGIRGLLFFPTWKRAYPQGNSALEVLGLVDVDGNGISGLELVLDGVLRGSPRCGASCAPRTGPPRRSWRRSRGSPEGT